MPEQRIGIVMFAAIVLGLALWSAPSTEVDASVEAAESSAVTDQVDAVRAARARQVAARPVSAHAMEAAVYVEPSPRVETPRWQLVDPEKSVSDWNVDMAELLTALDDCPELYDETGDSAMGHQISAFRAMFDDEWFNPNENVGTYQIATVATDTVRELLESEGCL